MTNLIGAGILGVILAAVTGALAGGGAYTFYYAHGASYLSNDPKACVNCHIMRDHYDGWQKSSHHAVASCNDCHVPPGGIRKWLVKAENGYWHSRAFTFQDFHEPIRIRPGNAAVLEENCIRCHQGVVEGIIAGHAPASSPDGLFGCVRCHQAVGHGPPR